MEKKISKYEDRIDELEDRVAVLEKDLRKRKRSKLFKAIFDIICVIIVVCAAYYGYNYVNEKYIKPYKEAMSEINSFKEKLDKLPDFTGTIGDYIGKITK